MYIQIERENIWQVYTTEIAKDGLLRGGGNTSSAKMFKSNNGEESVRPADFKIVFDAPSGEHFVYPDLTKGLSFSSNLQRLRDIPIPGRVWLLPRDRKLPEGLVINYKTIDHPLLNVARKMKMSELIAKLKEVEAMMKDTGVKI
jgi:hypothetical protein